MISLLASYAQEESLSASENQKWRIRRNFEAGKPWDATLMGYRYENGRYVIQPDEAEIVRRIFREYLGGKGADAIANDLNADGIPTRLGYKWRNNGVLWILRNYTYTGNLLLQKYYRDDYISKKSRINRGQIPRFHVTAAHDPIICVEDYEAVQEEIERRAAKHAKKGKDYNARYPYSGLIVCAGCGKKYRRKVKRAGPVWICSTYNTKGKTECASKAIPEAVLDELTADIDLTSIAQIQAEKDNRLVFCYKDGTTQEKLWQDRWRTRDEISIPLKTYSPSRSRAAKTALSAGRSRISAWPDELHRRAAHFQSETETLDYATADSAQQDLVRNWHSNSGRSGRMNCTRRYPR